MQTKSPSLLPILRSRALADLLTRLLVAEDAATISALASRIGAAPSTVKREVDQLEAAGIVFTYRDGRNRVVLANTMSPFYPELRALFLKAFGPVAVVREEFGALDGVEALYVFGSWARRHGGETGPLPRDLDLLVLGDAEPEAVYTAARAASRRLGLEVNPTISTADEWESSASPFLVAVREGPIVPVP